MRFCAFCENSPHEFSHLLRVLEHASPFNRVTICIAEESPAAILHISAEPLAAPAVVANWLAIKSCEVKFEELAELIPAEEFGSVQALFASGNEASHFCQSSDTDTADVLVSAPNALKLRN